MDLIIYFGERIFQSILTFIRDYFKGGFNLFLKFYQDAFFRAGKKTGFFANWRYFKVPLWREYSVLSYILSIPIRIIALCGGAIVLLIITIVFAVLAFLWLFLPFYLLIKIIYPLNG